MTGTRGIRHFDGLRLAAEYQKSRGRMIELLQSSGVDPERTTVAACPAWSVHDLFSHVTGIAVDLSAGRPPAGDSQEWVDRQVAERRSRRLSDVLEEWHGVGSDFESMIASSPKAMWGLVYDLVVHEFDLRQAAGDREGRDADFALLAAELGLNLVKNDLRKAGLGAVAVEMAGEVIVVGEGEVQLTLRTNPFECLRLLGSRRTMDEVRKADFEGDLDRYFPGLFHMELPMRSLGE